MIFSIVEEFKFCKEITSADFPSLTFICDYLLVKIAIKQKKHQTKVLFDEYIQTNVQLVLSPILLIT